jgi:hypothetical protein
MYSTHYNTTSIRLNSYLLLALAAFNIDLLPHPVPKYAKVK